MNGCYAAFFFLFTLSSGLDKRSDYPNVSDENWKKLQQVTSMSDFKRLFNIKDNEFKKSVYENVADEGQASYRFAVEECKTIPKFIEFADVVKPSGYVYLPSCFIAHRCDGCSLNSRHQCEPVASETHYMGVRRIGVGVEYIWVPYRNDTKCAFKCKTKESDANCNEHQVYIQDTCSCECKAESKAKKCPPKRQYSDISCKCECSLKDCTGGRTLNETTCECESKPVVIDQNGIQMDANVKEGTEDISNESTNTIKDEGIQHNDKDRISNIVEEDFNVDDVDEDFFPEDF